ncbi:MAG TPA: metalloregulator ArsR/SmtB family transcription factor [Candidatus Thermoplasmatota archaeon]|jgi:DNA-binding transcriptional ArsR family regulator|nr:metalloregulator ArsR/SmtB family transcription factor [Candidatus Thermoplasmatota archaeon]
MPPRARARAGGRPRPPAADAAFRAIADPTRRAILLDLGAAGELTAGDIADRFVISRPAVSKHLAVLRRAGLVHERRAGRERRYALDHAPLREVGAYLAALDAFWAGRLEELGRALDDA